VREMCLEAYVHQDLPFEKLVEVLRPERDPSRPPFFQVTFALQNAREKPLALGGLQVTLVSLNSETVRFDLECHVWEAEEGLAGNIVYIQTCLKKRPCLAWPDISGACWNRQRRPGPASLGAGAVARRRAAAGAVRVERDADGLPAGVVPSPAVRAWAERTPDAAAVVWGERELSYAQLNERANRLARYLRGLGVGPEALVGLCVERSAEMVVACWAS